MVSLKEVQASNARIASALPRLVAVFVGATSGIGEAALKQFAKHAQKPRVYFVGRSQEAADRIVGECKSLNPDGEFIFIKADTSLIRNVDDICKDIRTKEEAINILFISAGTLNFKAATPEGLNLAVALAYYSRTRFITNLLPLIQKATALRRVVSVFAATTEGPIDTTDFPGVKISRLSTRGHISSIITLSLEALAKQAPDVSFIHDFPGTVKTNLIRGGEGAAIFTLSLVFKVIGPLLFMSTEECGERHLFFATSARYAASAGVDTTPGVPLASGGVAARGTDGKVGSGVYSINWDGESAGPKVEKLLAGFRKEGVTEKLWKHTEEEYKRITGVEAA